jgi:hypothetical protein
VRTPRSLRHSSVRFSETSSSPIRSISLSPRRRRRPGIPGRAALTLTSQRDSLRHERADRSKSLSPQRVRSGYSSALAARSARFDAAAGARIGVAAGAEASFGATARLLPSVLPDAQREGFANRWGRASPLLRLEGGRGVPTAGSGATIRRNSRESEGVLASHSSGRQRGAGSLDSLRVGWPLQRRRVEALSPLDRIAARLESVLQDSRADFASIQAVRRVHRGSNEGSRRGFGAEDAVSAQGGITRSSIPRNGSDRSSRRTSVGGALQEILSGMEQHRLHLQRASADLTMGLGAGRGPPSGGGTRWRA